MDLGPLRVPVATMRRDGPEPGWLFASALTALLVTVALVGVLIAWWIMA